MKELHNVRANVEYLLEISSPPQPQRSTEKSRQSGCLLFVFSVPTERAAIATGNDLRGLGICHQQAFSRNSGNGISAKYAILRKIALLASSFRNLAKNSTLILFGQPPIMYSEYFVGGLLCIWREEVIL